MLNDYEIACLLQDQYDGDKTQFDVWEPSGIVSYAVKVLPDAVHIFFEGSHDLPDWERDFHADMIQIPGLGGVHSGFYEGLPEVLAALMPILPKDRLISVNGHSLGGGEADIFVAMLGVAGFDKVEGVTFGKPVAGDAALEAKILKFTNRTYVNYCDPLQHDLVCDVPFTLPNEPYDNGRQRIKICQSSQLFDSWGALSWHHLSLYIKGVQKLCAIS